MSYDIRDGRAMISLGPLSGKRYCTYACAFCYVQADFKSYPARDPEEIRNFLEGRIDEFDIVYISGDTDSFAPGRTGRGINLLESIACLGKDVLFTTRAPLSESDLDKIAKVNFRLSETGNNLFGCISISRLHSAEHIEPRPVPTPERRIEVLKGLKSRGIFSILAMRPFLPIIPVHEYIDLVKLASPHVDAVLGEAWYADKAGVLERQVYGDRHGELADFEEKRMDFDSNDALWKVWRAEEVSRMVSEYCLQSGIPFFMRSRPAIQHLRKAGPLGFSSIKF